MIPNCTISPAKNYALNIENLKKPTLPSILAQADTNFTLAILIEDSLPQEAKDHLSALTIDILQVKIIALVSGPYRDVKQEH